jgi:hypothetical protein
MFCAFIGSSRFAVLAIYLILVGSAYAINTNDPPNFLIPAAAWETLGEKGLSDGGVGIISLAVDSTDLPYIAFSDYANSFNLTVMKFDGNSWISVGAKGFTSQGLGRVVLNLDSSDTPYVAYHSGGENELSVAKYTGTTWVVLGSEKFVTTNDISLEFDSSDTPYLAYDSPSAGSSKVVSFDGTNWVAIGDSFSSGTTRGISLKIDSNDTVYVAFSDHSLSLKATVKKFENLNWVGVGSAGFSDAGVSYTALGFDSTDTPYLAFRDSARSGKATLMKFVSSNWVAVGSEGFSDGDAKFTSLAMDSDDAPYVAFQDVANDNKATVMKFNGSDWTAFGGKGFSDDTVTLGQTSLGVTSNNELYLAFRDESINGEATVMSIKAGILGTSVPEHQSIAFTVPATDPNGDDLSFAIEGGVDSAAFSIDATSGLLKFLSPPNFESPGDSGTDNVYDLIVKVSDSTLFTTTSVQITVIDTNDPPEMTVPTNLSIDEDFGTTTVILIASDLQNDNISFSAVSSNSDLVAVENIIGNTLSLSSNLNVTGNTSITVTATATGGSDTVTFAVIINPVNDAPVFVSQAVSPGTTFIYFGTPGFGEGLGFGQALSTFTELSTALDSEGNVHIAYGISNNQNNKTAVYVRKWDGSAWSGVGAS